MTTGHRPSLLNPLQRHLRLDGTLDALCWCQFTTVVVSAAEIRAGRTGCCGTDYCRRLEEVAMNR